MSQRGHPQLQLDPLTEAATRRLRDNPEHQVAAAGFLETLRQPGDPQAEAVIARWNEIDTRKPRNHWVRAAVAAWIIVVVGILWCDRSRFVRSYERAGWMVHLDVDDSELTREALERLANRATAGQRFALFGTAPPADIVTGRKSVWEKHPEDPALFAIHATSHLRANERLPDGFLETARRIDPENAWFVYLAAALEARSAVQREPRKYRTVGGRRISDPVAWKILKPAAYARSMQLLREAGCLPRFDSYRAANTRMMLDLLPDGSFEEYSDSVTYAGCFALGGKLWLRNLISAMEAAVWRAGIEGNQAAYEAVRDDGERMLRLMMAEEPSGAVDEMINLVVARDLSRAFAETSAALGLEEEGRKWRRMWDRFEARGREKEAREFVVDGQVVDSENVSGLLVGLGGMAGLQRQVAKPPPLSGKDLRPLRMMEHEMMSWILSWLVFAMVGLLLALFVLYRFRIAPLVRMLAERFESLLGPRDWMMILAGGLLVPLLYVTAVNRLSPWGVRATGLSGTDMLLPMAQFAGLLVLWLLSSWWIVRRRLAKRAAAYGFTCPGSWFGLPLLGALAFVPIMGVLADLGVSGSFWGEWTSLPGWFMEVPDEHRAWLWTATGVFAFPCIVMLIAAAMALVGGNNGMLRQAVVARVMTRVCAAAMLVGALASVGFRLAEHHWFAVDTTMRIDPDIPNWSRYEYQCALRMREELRDLLEPGR